jgi:hypothetical protein
MYSFKPLLIIGLLFASAYCQQRLLSFNAAKLKLETAINILSTANEEDNLYIGAVVAGVDAIFGGSMIVLPSKLSTLPIQQESMEQPYEGMKNPILDFERGPKGFNATITNIDMLLEALNTFLGVGTQQPLQGEKILTGTGVSSREVVLTAMDLLVLTKEILLNLARYTIRCNPNIDLNLQDDYCKLFLESDEAGPVLDEILGDMTSAMSRFFREVRSPLFAIQSGPLSSKIQSYQTEGLGVGECTAIVQDYPGLKVVFRIATISFWNFPWLGSSALVGKKAFVFEWVPAQFIKTITLCNHMNPTTEQSEILQSVNSETVIHRGMLHLWNLMPVTSQ